MVPYIFSQKEVVEIQGKGDAIHIIRYALCTAQSMSGKAQPYLPNVDPRVPRSVHAKFHADWSKTTGTRGIPKNQDLYTHSHT